MIAYVLFSYSKKIGSTAIRKFQLPLTKYKNIKEVPSHTSVRVGSVVYESTFEGVRATTFESWITRNIIIQALPIGNADKIHMDRITCLFGRKYDYAGLFYFAWRIILLKLFKMPLPKKNKWHKMNKYFCTEILSVFTEKDYQMSAPVQIMEELRDDFYTSII